MKKTIKKRNGTIVPFDKERIIQAIYKAMISVNEENSDIAKQIADKIESSYDMYSI